MSRYLVCVTGASGAVYGVRILSRLARSGAEVHLIATSWGSRVVLEETGRSLSDWVGALRAEGAVLVEHDPANLAAPPSSGSYRFAGTLVAPCSMGTAAAMAAGLSANLVQRAGAVALKEGWPLVLVPRESPLSLPAIKALLALKEAGASILPACPAFYARPSSVDELVDQIAYRALDILGLALPGSPRWDGSDKGEE
jgi:4-hydroxy-3-polyprenylbenzoate decarboxylase